MMRSTSILGLYVNSLWRLYVASERFYALIDANAMSSSDRCQTVDIADIDEEVDSTGEDTGGARELTASPWSSSSAQSPTGVVHSSDVVFVVVDVVVVTDTATDTDGLTADALPAVEWVFICRVSLLDWAHAYGQKLQRYGLSPVWERR